MRVVIAPDKFKGSLTAAQVAAALEAGVRDVVTSVECRLVPMADGGDGTVAAFLAAGATPRTVRVSGPLGEPVEATYARQDETAIVEMASASGLALLQPPLQPRRATTRGTGELLRDALDGGARRIVLAIGGSATTDGGAGALAALGARFLNDAGSQLDPAPEALASLARIDLGALDPRLAHAHIAIASDVDNPLLGPSGAAAVYGPQKGASPEDVAFLDGVLKKLADALAAAAGRDLRTMAGAGAAGGLGWALATVCGARLERGVDLVARTLGLADALRGAAWCFTGEGRIDAQTLHGKVVDGVAGLARAAGARVVAFGGSVDPAAEPPLRARGVACLPIVPGPQSLDDALQHTSDNLRAAAARAAQLLQR